MGGVETAVRASTSSGPTMAAVPCGINGFGRIGRLVARIMIKDPETNVRHMHPSGALHRDVLLAPSEFLCSLQMYLVLFPLRCICARHPTRC